MRKNRQAVYVLLCASVLALGGCKVKRPKEVIAEDKMENILYDYHLAKALGEELPMEENYKRQLYIDAVFRKYGVTEAEFDSSMVWYTRNTSKLDDIYEHVTDRLKDNAKGIDDLMAVREKRNSTSVVGDSVDVWAWRKVMVLENSAMNNLFTFVLAADTNYKVNDLFVWSTDVLLNGKFDGDAAPVVSLQLVYDNDSVVGVTRHVARAGKNVITLGDDKIGRVKTINGFIYRPISERSTGDIIVSNISLMRYHTGDTIIAKADTLSADSLSNDSLKLDVEDVKVDTAVKVERLTPEEMNRRRTTAKKPERPEQIEVERKIQKEHQELEKSNKTRRLPPSRKR
jgi:hypothetical protein